jgi:hypothetical protein
MNAQPETVMPGNHALMTEDIQPPLFIDIQASLILYSGRLKTKPNHTLQYDLRR